MNDTRIKGIWFLGDTVVDKNSKHNLGDLLGFLIPKILFPKIKVFSNILKDKNNALICI